MLGLNQGNIRVLVSIVIPAFNSAATMGECLDACRSQTHGETEIIVVDDGSTDDTATIVKALPVHYLRQENRGPAAARNRGVEAAEGEIIAFTDADCVPEPEWIERLLEDFDSAAAAVGGAYAIANPNSLFAHMVHTEIVLRHARFDRDVDFLGSFNLAIRRKDFEEAEGFDESFTYASAEDNDLAYRLKDAGKSLRFSPNARVAHYHPSHLLPYLRSQSRHGFWRMKLYAKHPGRARGDRYAGLPDFAGPPLALILSVSIAVAALKTAWTGFSPLTFALPLTLCVLYLVLLLPAALQMAWRAGDPRMAVFAAVRALRDLARGLGMVAGFWTFIIRGRS